MFDINIIRVEFFNGVSVNEDIPFINLLEWNKEAIRIPSGCTGFAIVHKKVRINGNDGYHKTRRLIGAFVATEEMLKEIKEKYPEESEVNFRCPNNKTCVADTKEEPASNGQIDYLVQFDELERILNGCVSEIVPTEKNAQIIKFSQKYLMQRMKERT